MKKLQTDYVLIGSGAATMLAACRLASLEKEVVILNPFKEFNVDDIMPRHGLGLWNLSYFIKKDLNELYDLTLDRIRDIYPASLENSGFNRVECWSILSSTPVHREKTAALEKEFFKLERKSFTSGQYHLLNADHVHAFGTRMGLNFNRVAQIDGAVQRAYSSIWDPYEIGSQCIQYLNTKFADKIHYGIDLYEIKDNRVVFNNFEGDTVSLEATQAVYILLSGDLLFPMKNFLKNQNESWLKGIRKKRRERSFAWFQSNRELSVKTNEFLSKKSTWFELGGTHYYYSDGNLYSSWTTRTGPDGMDRIIDEGLRIQMGPNQHPKFIKEDRCFWLEWEWKNPSWRKTGKNSYWGTSFEGDLPATLELLWNLPNI